MGSDTQVNRKAAKGTSASKQIALGSAAITTAATCWVIFKSDTSALGWFAYHPPAQAIALLSLVYGIVALHGPKSQKLKAIETHQNILFVITIPAILFGTYAAWQNKELRGRPHFVSFHAQIGSLCALWALIQAIFGSINTNAIGKKPISKMLWKYHKLSGYVLFPLLLLSVHTGGAWSAWGAKTFDSITRHAIYSASPLLIIAGVFGYFLQ